MQEENYDAIYHLEKNNWWYKAKRDLFALLLRRMNKRFDRALDLGCGTGANVDLLRRFAHEVIGVDYSPKAIAYCLDKGYAKLQQMDAEHLAFADNHFDLILCSDVLEHLQHDRHALHEIHRVLKPGGTLLLSVPAHKYLFGPVDVISNHYRRYEMPELRQLLGKEFNIIRLGYWNLAMFIPNLVFIKISNFLQGSKKPKNTLELLPPAVNSLLYRMMGWENRLFASFNLFQGVSLVGMCSKKSMIETFIKKPFLRMMMKKQRILLVKPADVYPVTKKGIYNRVWMPVSLANCAALLEKQGHEVKIIDAHAARMPLQELISQAGGYDKVFVTSTDLERWECPGTDIDAFIATSQEIGKINSNVFVMGVHGTLHPEEILEKTNAKAVIRGEPEMIVADLCKSKALSTVKGITYKENGRTISNLPGEPIDMTLLPTPSYHLLDMSKYTYEVLGDHFALFEGSRGCPYGCAFCLKTMFGKIVRKKTAEQIIKEVDEAITKHGVKTAQFIDLEYTMNKDVYHKVLDHLIQKKYDFKWCCQARADNFEEGLLQKMKLAGCKMILCGIETGSDKMMKSIRKGLSLEKVKEGIATAKKVGIETVCFFMFGFPGETKEDMQQTIKFAKELDPTYVSFHDLIPFETTDMFKYKENLDNKELAQAMRRKGYIHFYLRPQYVLSRLAKGDFHSLGKQVKLFLGFVQW